MPLPHVITRANRRVLNRLMRPIARRIPPLAVIHHTGRQTGQLYETPIMVFRHGDEFVIAFTYGAGTDWQRNLEAAGEAELTYRGARWTIGNPREVHGDALDQPFPRIVQLALTMMRVREFLVVSARRAPG